MDLGPHTLLTHLPRLFKTGAFCWLLTGGSLWDAFANADNLSILFASSRILHMITVVAALVFYVPTRGESVLQS